MTTIKSKYLGELRTEALHVTSNTILHTDAPVDNNGKGASFSPTDLLAAALGGCMVTIIGIKAEANGFEVGKIEWETTKVMGTNPRRVSEIVIAIHFTSANYTEKQKTIIEDAALNCPVAKSLNPDLKQTVSFHFN